MEFQIINAEEKIDHYFANPDYIMDLGNAKQ